MRIVTLFLLMAALLCKGGEMRTFTDAEGRKITAELTEARADSVSIRRKDGRKFDLEMAKLSADDQKYARDWIAKRDAEAAAKKRAVDIPAKLLAYCKGKIDQQVGNGECWTLADEAFKACGLKRPGNHLRVWGRLVDYKKEPVQAGDVVEFRSAKFSDGSYTGPEHTAVITKPGKRGKFTLAEQNWSGIKKVHEREMDPGSLTAGELMIYRPE